MQNKKKSLQAMRTRESWRILSLPCLRRRLSKRFKMVKPTRRLCSTSSTMRQTQSPRPLRRLSMKPLKKPRQKMETVVPTAACLPAAKMRRMILSILELRITAWKTRLRKKQEP